MKLLKHDSVKLLIVHGMVYKCDLPFSIENLIVCGVAKYDPCYLPSKGYYDLQPKNSI